MPQIRFVALSSRLPMLFLVAGMFSFVVSYLYESSILALIGLGLVFWGALFFFTGQVRQVDVNILYKDLIPSYTTYDRIIADFKCKGNGCFIPAFPKDVYLPAHLKGLKDIIVYISVDEKSTFPNLVELAEGKFFLKNSQGIVISPPGLGLFGELESKRVNLTKLTIEQLSEVLPQLIMENYALARAISMKTKENEVFLKITDSVYMNLYKAENNLKSVEILGCPLASAVGCIVAKTSGKPVILQKYRTALDGSKVEIQFLIKEENS